MKIPHFILKTRSNTEPKKTHKALGMLLALLCADVAGLYAPQSQAGVHFTLQSSLSENNIPLSSQNARSASASVAVDLGTYLRLGLTHRQAINKSKGYAYNEAAQNFEYRMEQSHIFANSLDFTIILYYGDIFVPFLQVGIVKKDYFSIVATDQDKSQSSKYSLPPVPNGGVGLGIRLNQNFSLKLSYTVSPGVRQPHPQVEQENVLDSFTSVGISYNI